MKRLVFLACLLLFDFGCAGPLQSAGDGNEENEVNRTRSDVAPVWQNTDGLSAYCAEALKTAEEVRIALKSPVPDRSADSILTLYNDMLLALDEPGGIAGLMADVHPEREVREVAEQCRRDFSAFHTALGLDRGLYDVLKGLEVGDKDADTQRFVGQLLRDFRRAGVDKDESIRKRMTEIQASLVKLTQDFSRNVREDVRSITVESVDELAGMPADWIASRKPEDDGSIRITTDYPDFYPFQTYARNSAHRKALYEVFLSRGYPANVSVLKEVLALRHESATLLGYSSWAQYNAEDKMAKDASTIESFIVELNEIIRPVGEREIKELVAYKRQEEPGATTLESYDRFYYVGKVRKEKHDFDSQALRPYFSYSNVKDGILSLYGELFGLEFSKLENEPVWHPSVEAYVMYADGVPLGRFYLDMHPRENKFKHAAMFNTRTGLSTGRLPVAALVCNFPDPSIGDGKALMEHTQVMTYFHEFGHLIHHLLARKSNWATLAGISVEWDFVEAPSQILEEWAWDPDILRRFAVHVETGESIPAELVEKLRASEEFGKGVHLMRQMFYTAFSFYLHNSDPDKINLDDYTNEIQEKFSPYPRIEGTHVFTNFGHLMGYSSMYYTYQWSLVIAKDLFTRFQAEGLMNKEVARDYRDKILAPGGARDANDLVQDFLGRPYNLDAYKGWLTGASKGQ